MEIMEIIKEAFVFPSKDLSKLAIYIVICIIAAFLLVIGVIAFAAGLSANAVVFSIIGVVLFILSLIIGLLIAGYQIGIIKSGIDHTEKAPDFDWQANIITGIKDLIVSIVYYIIPAIIVGIVGLITNVPGKFFLIFQQLALASQTVNATANATVNATSATVFSNAVSSAMIVDLLSALMVTGIVATILFIIFTFLQTMGQARLANTDSLGDAINIPEAFRDIGRIGWGKVIATVILIFIVIFVINLIISIISGYYSPFGIISIVISPYLVFFTARATGLLYSDIA